MNVKGYASNLAGVDLAVSRRSVVVAQVSGSLVVYELSKDELLRALFDMDVVAIDAPLTYREPYRDFELMMLRRGYRILPLSMKGMRKLYLMASELRNALSSVGIAVIETHPTSAFRAMGVPKPRVRGKAKDYLDASLCLLTVKSFLEGNVIVFKGKDGALVLPRREVPWKDLFSNVMRYVCDDPERACL